MMDMWEVDEHPHTGVWLLIMLAHGESQELTLFLIPLKQDVMTIT